MPEIESRNPEHPKTVVRLAEGETVALCRCFASATFPLCDGSHRAHPGRGPAIVCAPGAAPGRPAGDPGARPEEPPSSP